MFKKGIITAIATISIAGTADAQNCAMRDQIVERLESKYSEQLTAGGLQENQSDSSMMEIWASPKTGTFTVLMTNPNGVSCVVAAGTDFFKTEQVAVLPGVAS